MADTLTRDQRRQLERENAKRPAVLTEVPRTQWPDAGQPSDRVRAWVSRDYLVRGLCGTLGCGAIGRR